MSRKISGSTSTSRSMGRGGVPIARARLEWQFEHRTPFLIRNNNGPLFATPPLGSLSVRISCKRRSPSCPASCWPPSSMPFWSRMVI